MTEAFRNPPAVSLGQRMAVSQVFDALFREGMGLVERTAAYLDGSGREEARALARPASHAYAIESMRLTTRLMQLASWLLLQRAVNEGELTPEDAVREKSKVDLGRLEPLDPDHARLLPDSLIALIADVRDLQRRILRLDASIYQDGDRTEADNAVVRQMDLLKAAFGARG
ncbi:protease adaptor protein RcdA [Ancylobacter terrae]|uniref:protease adaptor protein RcdA n=1 Tax=Ancylobacter sp. sgz301288 TaxID=3342077 RepID=UPI00385C840E